MESAKGIFILKQLIEILKSNFFLCLFVLALAEPSRRDEPIKKLRKRNAEA